jgi:hypothetical protein
MGIRLLAGFFIFGAAMSGLAATTLFWPGTWLDSIWMINPEGHAGMMAAGLAAAAGMGLLCVVMSTTARGLWAQRLWAWWIALCVLVVNAVADLATAVLQHNPRTLIGVPIAGFMVGWMLRPRIRRLFR